MSAARRKKTAARKTPAAGATQLVFGLGKTGLSIARYLRRNGLDAIYVDSRTAPPGIEDLKALVPDAEQSSDGVHSSPEMEEAGTASTS